LCKATIDSPLPPPQQQQQNKNGERKGIDFPLTSGTQAAFESFKLEVPDEKPPGRWKRQG